MSSFSLSALELISLAKGLMDEFRSDLRLNPSTATVVLSRDASGRLSIDAFGGYVDEVGK